MSIRERAAKVPLLFDMEEDKWFFFTPNGVIVGPYSTWERATEKYHEYCAYTIFAPGCHHP